MSGFGNLPPGYTEPIGDIHPKLGLRGERIARRIGLHQEALDAAFETEVCAACSGTGSLLNGSICPTCWGTKDVPLNREQWRSALCEQLNADISDAIHDYWTALKGHNETPESDSAILTWLRGAMSASQNAAKDWRTTRPTTGEVLESLATRQRIGKKVLG